MQITIPEFKGLTITSQDGVLSLAQKGPSYTNEIVTIPLEYVSQVITDMQAAAACPDDEPSLPL